MCVAAAIAGAAVVGGAVSAYGANKAAGAQESAAQNASNTQMSMFNQTRADEQPYMQAGQGALGQLQSLYGLPGGKGMNGQQISSLLSSLPGYQFQMQQGTQAVDRSEAAKGLLNSGATGKALQQYGQGLGSSYFGQYVGGLQNMASLGQAATGQQAQVGMNTANQVGANQIYAGNARAAGDIGMGNAFNNSLGQAVGLYGLYQGGYGGYGNGGSPYGGPGGSIPIGLPPGTTMGADGYYYSG